MTSILRSNWMTDPKAAVLKTLREIEGWFDTDPEIIERMSHDERADHMRQHEKIKTAIKLMENSND